MVKLLRLFLSTLCLGSLWCTPADCRVIVNEVFANPHNGKNALKWIELYNDALVGASLAGYRIETSTRSLWFPDTLIIQPRTYFIICHQLISSPSDLGFEAIWGNSSGVWGDTDAEDEDAIFEAPLLLVVAADYVELYDSLNQLESAMTWNSSIDAGISLERVHPDSVSAYLCEDPIGATPGAANSITPMGSDLAISQPVVRSLLGNANVQFEVTNRGLDTVQGATLTIVSDSTDTIASLVVNELSPGESSEITWQEQFDGMYVDLEARLSADDRERNNTVSFVVPGILFPAFALSEIAPSERDGILSEWIELQKRIDLPWDIAGWKLRTERGETVIAEFTELISDDFLVLAEDAGRFDISYPEVDAHVLEPIDWIELINDHGTVALYDPFGILADSFSYSNGDDVLIWSRTDTSLQSIWGVSNPLLGSPGAPNDVMTAADSLLSLSVDPKILGTDDREDAQMHITFTAPPDEAITLKIFDRGGKEVRQFYDNEATATRFLVWTGRDDDNGRLPVGIYILYLQAGSAKAIKQPVVIAR